MSIVGPSVSALTPYCTSAQFLVIYDWRTIAELCSDNDVSALKSDLLDSTTEPGAVLIYALRSSSGDLETACLMGGRYSVADLQNATGQATDPDASGNVDSNAAWFIRRLVAAYAKWLLYLHRPMLDSQVPADAQMAAQQLAQLASGERIIPVQPAIDSGHIRHEIETPRMVEDRGLATYSAHRYFGRRNNRLGEGD